MMAKKDEKYSKSLYKGKLRYPDFPTINTASKKRPVLTPIELVDVVPGQSKSNGLPSDVSANIIRHAAMSPMDRFRYLGPDSSREGLLKQLKSDENVEAFGLNVTSDLPMKVQGFILPPPKLQYKNRVIEPELKGSWNLAGGVAFVHPPPQPDHGNRYRYGVVVSYNRSRPQGYDHMIDNFCQQLEHESVTVGMPLTLCDNPLYSEQSEFHDMFSRLKNQGARIVVVLLHYDFYNFVKLAADSLCLPTQCVTWRNFEKPPKNYAASLLIKMNVKLGGVNHTLASRLPKKATIQSSSSSSTKMEEDEEVFQSPPKSISWLLDEPCMVLVSYLICCVHSLLSYL